MLGILCVDDESLSLTAIAIQLGSQLDKERYLVDTESNPLQVIEHLRENEAAGVQPFLMITDYYMPDMNGDQLTRLVKQEFPSISVIMLSGNSQVQKVASLVEDDLLKAYVSKPWTPKELFGALNTCLPRKDEILINR